MNKIKYSNLDKQMAMAFNDIDIIRHILNILTGHRVICNLDSCSTIINLLPCHLEKVYIRNIKKQL